MASVRQTTPFGKQMREHFLFDRNFKNLNHGSFGTYPKPVRDQFRRLQDLAEASPDKFIRYQSSDHLLASRTAAANLLNVPLDTCVFLQNATLGINTVLRNLVYAPGDVIVYFDTIYGACEKTIVSILETTSNVRARKVDGYRFPCAHELVVERFVEVSEGIRAEGLTAKVAVFDTVCALPGVRFPFERLTEECRRRGILSCVDAAHGIGHIPLDLGKLDPDFLVSNCHKWLFTPRGCALFHVPFRNQHLIRTTFPTSHGFVPPPAAAAAATIPTTKIRNPLPNSTFTPFVTLFQFVATTDNAPYYCVPAALEFRAHVCGGEQNLMRYLKQSMSEGGDRVAEILRTHVMQVDDDDDDDDEAGAEGGPRLRDCAFANVRLPITVGASVSVSVVDEQDEKNPSSPSSPWHISAEEMGRVVDYLQATFVHEFATFIAVYGYGGALWARLSGQVYLDLADWEWCGNVLAEVCARVREGVFREDGVGESVGEGKGMGTEELDGNGDFSGLKDVGERFKEFCVETE